MSNNIRDRRLAIGVSQNALAKRAGISRVVLNLFECGHVYLKADTLAKLDAALDVMRKEHLQHIEAVERRSSAIA